MTSRFDSHPTDPRSQHADGTAAATGPASRRLDPRDESGAVVVLVAVLMVAFLGLAAMAVDLGALFDHDRDLQTAADAGALAGAQELIYTAGSVGPAAISARDYVDTNVDASTVEASALDPWAPFVDSRSCTVDLRETGIPFFLAPAVGLDNGTVTAHARAEVKYVTGTKKLFPVAINYMNPHRFRFVFKNAGGATVHTLEIADPDHNGTFDSLASGGSFTPPAAGVYSIDLQAIDTDGAVGVELPGIGLWRAANPSDPAEKLYLVGMQHADGGGTVTVRIQVAATVTDPEISARLGNNGFKLRALGGGVYEGSVQAPTRTGNDGWEAHDLTIDNKIARGPIGRYLALHPDVPLRYLTFTPSFYDGYSGFAGQTSSLSAIVRTRVLNFGDHYVMKLGNQAGAGIYAGNWRIADIYRQPNTRDEIATTPIPESWTLNHPMVIGGPLEPQTGAATGQIVQGVNDRLAGHSPLFSIGELQSMTVDQVIDRMHSVYPDWEVHPDPYFVIIPIVEFTSLHGSSDPYTIAGFSGFYITDHSKSGDIGGVFIRWAAPGDWSDTKPPGNLYMETAVLTD